MTKITRKTKSIDLCSMCLNTDLEIVRMHKRDAYHLYYSEYIDTLVKRCKLDKSMKIIHKIMLECPNFSNRLLFPEA